MRNRKLWGYAKLGVLAVVIATVAFSGSLANATTSGSNHYQVTDTGFNSGSTNQTCSTSYCATTSAGGVTSGGETNSTSNTGQIGGANGSEPLLDVSVISGDSDLGVLTTETTATKTMVVKIRSYLSSGYVLQIAGDPPKYGGHTLTAMATAALSSPGIEQFGLNAVANTSPHVGADPLQVPTTQTSFGVPVIGYNTPNMFKYVDGDIIARSPKSSGETDFTISMIVNISNTTPAGEYAGDFSAVVVPVY